MALLTQIHEYKGEQSLFIEAKEDTLTQMVEIARIQSTEASNKIEGIYKIQIYEDQPIRTAWVEDEEEWYFSIVDVVRVLTESKDGTAYWRKLKQRLKKEGNETVTNCHGLKMTAQDGKKRLTDVANGDPEGYRKHK